MSILEKDLCPTIRSVRERTHQALHETLGEVREMEGPEERLVAALGELHEAAGVRLAEARETRAKLRRLSEAAEDVGQAWRSVVGKRKARTYTYSREDAEMSRTDELLREAADAFEDGRSPFSTEWLSEHDVSFSECVDLSERIAAVLRGYLHAPKVVRDAFPLFTSDEMPSAVREHTFHRFYESRALASVAEHIRDARVDAHHGTEEWER